MINRIRRELLAIPGWSTKRKIVVIESDDWGAIRTPSRQCYDNFKEIGVDMDTMDAQRYSLNDTLECAEDLERLYEVLMSVRSFAGKHPAITAICVVANPDFNRIRAEEFTRYYYEPFTNTLEWYYPGQMVFEKWKEGISKGLFVPQFHGREHLNVKVWMDALRKGDKIAHLAFENRFWSYNNKHEFNIFYQAAFELANPDDLSEQQIIVRDGLELFERLFGYKASFFVPPNGIMNNRLEKSAAEGGIRFISTSKLQYQTLGFGKRSRTIHYLGQRNSHHQRYIIRNCFFEPSQAGKDWVDSCLSDIQLAFRWNKPAIIGSHRVNYVGSLSTENRESGLRQLKRLLHSIVSNWPDVEFLTTSELGELMNSRQS